jgi:hypothetical protein
MEASFNERGDDHGFTASNDRQGTIMGLKLYDT